MGAFTSTLFSQTFDDSLRIMTYNVLNFGDACQGQPSSQYQNLRTIIGFTNPDVVGMVKMQSIKSSPTDVNGISSFGFADTVVAETFNKVFPNSILNYFILKFFLISPSKHRKRFEI